MSIGAIFSSSYANYAQQNIQSRFQQFQQEFQQLGQDLQSGKISAAQQDFSALQQLNPQANSTPRRRAAARSRRSSNSLPRTYSPAISPPRRRTTPPSSRISRTRRRSRAKALKATTATITMAEAVSRVRSVSSSANWARSCSPATLRRHSRPTTACSRTSSSPARALRRNPRRC